MSKSIFQRVNQSEQTTPQNQTFTADAVIEQYKQIGNDRTQIFDIMLKNGHISQAQYADLKQMTNPRDALDYLLKSGAMSKNPLNQLLSAFMGGRR